MIDVKHIAKLARFDITKKEEEKLKGELSLILGYVEKLKELDVADIKPTSHSVELENVMREDEVKKQSQETIEKLVSAMPRKEKRYAKVKSIL